MVDDHTQRPYRSNEAPARGASPKASGSSSDPLAELARLIGQNDPFSEFDRDGQPRVAPPRAPEPAHDWNVQPAEAEYTPQAQAPQVYSPDPRVPAAHPHNYGRQQFGGAPLSAGPDLYQVESEGPGYPAQHDQEPGYEDVPYNQNNAHLAAEEEDFYDDEPPTRRRMGILVIAGVFALAVVGTAGAFGYRALFGPTSVVVPPPVIKADSSPSKIVPVVNTDAQTSKQITDRVNDRGLGEKIVSREEQPVAPQPVVPQPQDANQSSSPAPLGSGIVGSEPKKVRTIAIHPDQSATADATPAPPPVAPPARVTNITPAKQTAAPPPRVVNNPPPASDDPELAPAPRVAVARPIPVQQAAPAGRNAPLSLSPDAPARAAPARVAASPMRTAAVPPAQSAPAAASGGGGSYAVQVSAQRSEAEAQAAFRNLQQKFPSQLGGKQPTIRQVDLGEKGVYYRAMVGPFASGGEATELCSNLKAAGGSCIIQRN
jgi:hypothetical protein